MQTEFSIKKIFYFDIKFFHFADLKYLKRNFNFLEALFF